MKSGGILLHAAVTFFLVSTAWGHDTQNSRDDTSRAFLADSPWPVPTSDGWRSSSVPSGGLPANVERRNLRSQSIELGPVPFLSLIADDSLFVLGGSPFLLPLFTAAQANALPDLPDLPNLTPAELLTILLESGQVRTATPYVARINLRTMQVKTLDLPMGEALNYPGGIVAHQNGYLYAVATAKLHEIDPKTMSITASIDLPSLSSGSGLPIDTTVYNTLQVSPRNGDLLLKTGAFGSGNGILVRVDIDSFKVVAQTNTLLGTARSTAVLQDGVEYVYLPGQTETLRFLANDTSFEPDASEWSKPYRIDGDGSTPGVGMMYFGTANAVIFPNNNTVRIGVEQPLLLGLQSTIDNNVLPRSVNATGTSAPGGSFTMLAGNPALCGIVVAQDAVNGRLAGWRVCEQGTYELLWATDNFRPSIGAAVVINSNRLYVDHRVCRNEEEQKDCKLYMVMLDLETGKEIAWVRVAGTEPSLSHIVIGRDEVYYIASEARSGNGFVTKITTKHSSRRHR